jgi:Domain of unknown function (DUF3470)
LPTGLGNQRLGWMSGWLRECRKPLKRLHRFCVPECPVDAIKADTEPGLEEWLAINAKYARVWPNITVKREPPPDAKDWEGKPGKANLLSSNPGTGD